MVVMNAAAASRRVLVPREISRATPVLGARVADLAGQTMGTGWSVRLAGAPTADLPRLAQGVQRVLDAVVAEMSTWDPATALCRFNAAEAGTWQALPPAFCEVLACGLEIAAASGGAFDPTAGALVDAWGFGPRPPGTAPAEPPSDAAIATALARTGHERLQFDRVAFRARQPGGLALDFSAIAKGHGVDAVSRWLDGQGFGDHLVEVGGELRGSGLKPDGTPWWVALESVPGGVPGALPQSLVALHGLAVATSGDYRRAFEHDGRCYSHTLDPRSGWPIRHGVASVSVLHASGMAADAWSTALTVAGVEDGLELADRYGIAARFVRRVAGGIALEEHLSRAFLDLAR